VGTAGFGLGESSSPRGGRVTITGVGAIGDGVGVGVVICTTGRSV
jgi:hypothetical protein